MRMGSCAPDPENTIVIVIDIVEVLSFCDFFLSDFSRIFVALVIGFFVIWLHPLSYFNAWTDSLGLSTAFGAFIERYESMLETSPSKYPTLSSKTIQHDRHGSVEEEC